MLQRMRETGRADGNPLSGYILYGETNIKIGNREKGDIRDWALIPLHPLYPKRTEIDYEAPED